MAISQDTVWGNVFLNNPYSLEMPQIELAIFLY